MSGLQITARSACGIPESGPLRHAEIDKELVACGSSFFINFNPQRFVIFFSRKVSPIIDDSTIPRNARRNIVLTQGIYTCEDKNFTNTTLNHMLENVLYTGVSRSGDTLLGISLHLQIVTPEIFSRAAQIMSDRTQHKIGTLLSTKGYALLTVLLYCAH